MRYEQLNQKFLDVTDVLYCVFDVDGNFANANRAFLGMLSIQIEELKKSQLKKFIHHDDLKSILKIIGNPNARSHNFKIQTRILPENCTQRIVNWSLYWDSELSQCYAIGRDDTDFFYSEKFLEQAQIFGKVGSWEYDCLTQDLQWSDTTYKIYEISQKGRISIERINQFFQNDSLERFNRFFAHALKDAIPFDEEFDFISGQFRPTRIRMTGRPDIINEKVVKIHGIIQDITNIRQMEQRDQDYKEAIDRASIVTICDRFGTITHVNAKLSEISGYSSAELIGQDPKILNSSFHQSSFWKNLWDTISEGKIWVGEIKNKTKYGNFFWINATIVPFRNASGKVYQYLSIGNDVTENKKLTEEIMVSEKLSSIGEISAQILHEVMNPLSIISLNLDSMSIFFDQLEHKDEKMQGAARRLVEIKDSYLRIEEIFENMRSILVRKEERSSIEMNVREVLNKTISLIKAKLKDRNIKIDISRCIEDVSVKCNESDISQVFLNLIKNSIDAIEELPNRWIEVSAATINHKTIIKLVDSGNGIPENVRDKIFDTLFTTKGKIKGTGLGMGLCRKLVERHSGVIYLDENALNTTFIIELPSNY